LFYSVELFIQVGELFGSCGGNFLFDKLLVSSDGSVDLGLGFAIPFDECGFGDAESASNGGKAQALDPEAKEFGAAGGGVHEEME
jgi:hypothetical protein